MVIDANANAVTVRFDGFQVEEIHMLGMIVYLVNSLAEKRPDMETVKELKSHVDRLLGESTGIIQPGKVN